jgi:hypothetical protein
MATDASITETCLAVGFESLGSFSTRFRRSFGASPAAWRKSARSEKPRSPRLAQDWTMFDRVQAQSIIVLADCHIPPTKGISWPRPVLEAFRRTDLFVTLGDLGESASLDALACLAPVIGVRGRDDEDDPRTAPTLRVLAAGSLRPGCIFDPAEAGPAKQPDRAVWGAVREIAAGVRRAPRCPAVGNPPMRRRSGAAKAVCSSTRAARRCRARMPARASPD